MLWPDTRAAVHMAPAKSPRSSDFSNSVEAARSAARQKPPYLPQNLKKLSFAWGSLGGSGPKTHWGMCLLDKRMILQGGKLTIQPLGV